MQSILVVVALLLQEDVSTRLKKEEWRGVQALIEQGERSRAALEKADPEVAFYAQAALAELDRVRAGETAVVARLRAAEGPAGTLMVGLFKSAGIEIAAEGLPARRMALPEGLSFAEAVDAASRELDVEFAADDKGTWKAGGSFLNVPRFASGMVRARLDRASRGTYWRPGLPPEGYLWLTGHVEGFGRFRAPALYSDIRVVQAVDEHGRDLRWKKEWRNDSLKGRSGGRDPAGAFTVSLQTPDSKTTRVARLRLAADFSFKKKAETITFLKPAGARNVKQKVGDVEATLVRAGMDGETFNVELKLAAPGICERLGGDDARLFGPSLEVKVVDSEGRAWESGNGGSGSDARAFTFHAGYQNPGGAGPPAAVSFALTTEVETRSLYFEFREVTLP